MEPSPCTCPRWELPSSSRAFQRHQEHDLKHPGSVDLITTKQNKLPSLIDRLWFSFFSSNKFCQFFDKKNNGIFLKCFVSSTVNLTTFPIFLQNCEYCKMGEKKILIVSSFFGNFIGQISYFNFCWWDFCDQPFCYIHVWVFGGVSGHLLP